MKLLSWAPTLTARPRRLEGSVAVCTFHLERPNALARRTIVLVRRGRVWKILGIHASDAVTG